MVAPMMRAISPVRILAFGAHKKAVITTTHAQTNPTNGSFQNRSLDATMSVISAVITNAPSTVNGTEMNRIITLLSFIFLQTQRPPSA